MPKTETKKEEELKPCPFCGGEAVIALAEGDEDKGLWDIDCSTKQGQCFIPINNFPFKTEAEAITAWNTRAALEGDCDTCRIEQEFQSRLSAAEQENARLTERLAKIRIATDKKLATWQAVTDANAEFVARINKLVAALKSISIFGSKHGSPSNICTCSLCMVRDLATEALKDK